MRIGELAQKIHVSRVHAWRLASAGIVPGTRKTKGGQFYFVQSHSLTRWINLMIGGKFRKKEMSRAYKKHYGLDKLEDKRSEQILKMALKKAFNRALRDAHILNLNDFDNFDYFYAFHFDIGELTKILQQLIQWRESRLKSEMVKLSRERLIVLRDLINEWLKGEN